MKCEMSTIPPDVSESKLKAMMDKAQKKTMEAMALPKEVLNPPEEIDALMSIIMWHENASQWCRFVMIAAEWDE